MSEMYKPHTPVKKICVFQEIMKVGFFGWHWWNFTFSKSKYFAIILDDNDGIQQCPSRNFLLLHFTWHWRLSVMSKWKVFVITLYMYMTLVTFNTFQVETFCYHFTQDRNKCDRVTILFVLLRRWLSMKWRFIQLDNSFL